LPHQAAADLAQLHVDAATGCNCLPNYLPSAVDGERGLFEDQRAQLIPAATIDKNTIARAVFRDDLGITLINPGQYLTRATGVRCRPSIRSSSTSICATTNQRGIAWVQSVAVSVSTPILDRLQRQGDGVDAKIDTTTRNVQIEATGGEPE